MDIKGKGATPVRVLVGRRGPTSRCDRPPSWSDREDSRPSRVVVALVRRASAAPAPARRRAVLRPGEGHDRRRRVGRVHREPARGGDVRAGAGARRLHGRAAVRPPIAGGLADRPGVGADRSEARVPVVAAPVPRSERGRPRAIPPTVAGQDGRCSQPRGISVLTPSPAQDTNEFVANAETAQRFGLTTMTLAGRRRRAS